MRQTCCDWCPAANRITSGSRRTQTLYDVAPTTVIHRSSLEMLPTICGRSAEQPVVVTGTALLISEVVPYLNPCPKISPCGGPLKPSNSNGVAVAEIRFPLRSTLFVFAVNEPPCCPKIDEEMFVYSGVSPDPRLSVSGNVDIKKSSAVVKY